jgi:Uma2 family endonuclease
MSQRVDSVVAGRPMSLAEWAGLPEDDEGELCDGHLVEEEQVTLAHGIVLAWLAHALESWAEARGAFVGGEGIKLKLAARRGRKPDLAIYLPGDPRPALQASLVTALPSIVIEVVSKERSDARRDRIEKMDEYSAAGIRWYWLVDPQLRLFEIYELGADNRYVRALGASDGRLDVVPACDGLTLDLDKLWGRLDAFESNDDPTPVT